MLFTDVVGSTGRWQQRGDVEARLQLEQHDAILISQVERCRGRLIKTIGDSVMASFESAESAVRSAIAMQLALDEAREKDPDFDLRVRIGVHRGRAIVEPRDVYGDAVNVAARVLEQAEGDEILVSEAVAQQIDRERYRLGGRRSFTPRGKRGAMLLYRVSWWRGPVEGEVPGPERPVRPRRGITWALLGAAGTLAFGLALSRGPLEQAQQELRLAWQQGLARWQALALPAAAGGRADEFALCGLAAGLVVLLVWRFWRRARGRRRSGPGVGDGTPCYAARNAEDRT